MSACQGALFSRARIILLRLGESKEFRSEFICKQKYQVYHFTSSESSNKWQILNLKIINHKV